MRKSKRVMGAAIAASALSLLAVPGFAAGTSSSTVVEYLPAIAIGIVAVAAIVVGTIIFEGKKSKKAASANNAAAEEKKEDIKIEPVEAEESAVADTAEEIIAENEPVETVEVESDEQESESEAEPEVKYEAPVTIESVEVTEEAEPEVIEVPTVEVEEQKPEEPAEAPAETVEPIIVVAEQTEETQASTESELKEGEFRDAETGCIYTFNANGIPVPPEGMVIRYKWSFLGRLIQADDTVKYRYMMIRRLLLSYKKVRSNVSWNFDSYFLGRKPIAKVKVRGKHLVVYFNVDPAEMAGTKFVGEDVSKVSRYKAVPFAYRINGERKLQYAMELIRKLMEETPSVEPEFIEPGQAKYAIPFEDFESLFKEGYIKIGGFLAVSRASSAADDDDDDDGVTDAVDAEEEDSTTVAESEDVTPIEKEEFNYTPSKK